MKFIKNKGSGGFGNVDIVEDVKGNAFARKTFSVNQPGGLSAEMTENVKKRFIREAQIQSKITHPNIVSVHSMDIVSDPPSYIMELATSTMAEDIAADKTLGGNYFSALMDILAGLEELHSMAITHRDLKPPNVLRFNDGRYAISDFGLVSLKETQLSVLTTTGMAKGSDYYTAPEITSDLSLASTQSDIFSVGCILHDLVGTGPRVPCSEIKDDSIFADIIRCCTRLDPKRRFPTVAALREELLAVGVGSEDATEPRAVGFIETLDSADPIALEDWDRLVSHIEDNYPHSDTRVILRRLSHSRIAELIQRDRALAARLGSAYARWAKETSFDFSECDGISDRLATFMDLCDANCSVEILLSLLFMGTAHNRWHVERKFYNLCGRDLDRTAAKRLALEFRILGGEACNAIAHLEGSIGVSRSALHPLVFETLSSICRP